MDPEKNGTVGTDILSKAACDIRVSTDPGPRPPPFKLMEPDSGRPEAAAHYQFNPPPAPHFLAVGNTGPQPPARLYSMVSTPFSTPPMPKKVLFPESSQ